MIFRVGIFSKIILCIANTGKKSAQNNFVYQLIIYYKNDKCFLVLVIQISLLCFISFLKKKQKIIDSKKLVDQNFVIFFCFWLK